MTDPKDKKIADLEKQLRDVAVKYAHLSRQVDLLTRENNRRKSDITRLASAIKQG